MKFIFFGTHYASTIVLEKLVAAEYVPAAIVTNPDRPAGRKQVLTPPPVKEFVLSHNLRGASGAAVVSSNSGDSIRIFQPEKVGDIRDELVVLSADLFIVAFYGKLIPKSILNLPRLGTIGIHPSLLPAYRGPSPVQTAILDGAPQTGTTLYMMDEKMDEGPILVQEILPSYRPDEKSNIPLWEELAALGGEMAVHVLPALTDGSLKPTPQDRNAATYTKKFSSEDGFIPEKDFAAATGGTSAGATDSQLAISVHRKMLAFTPEPGAWTMENGKRIKLLEGKVERRCLVITRLQREGKKPESYSNVFTRRNAL
ncbi:MAG: methionyl-tRNA formyltransferase [Candidatus Liptonbacteria bacterium]